MTKTFLLISSVLLVACAFGGCTTSQERRTDTVQSTELVVADVTLAKQQLSISTQALTALRDAKETDDLQILRDKINSSQSELDGAIERVDANCADAVVTAREQSVAWQKKANAFTNSELRAASQKREGMLRSAVTALQASNTRLRAASQKYHNEVAQVVTALELDISFAGTRSIVPSLDRMVAGESLLRDALGEVADKAMAVGTANDD